MEKISVLLKLCYKFSKRYMASYLTALGKPVLFGVLGLLLLFTIFIDTKFVILSLLSIPCMCYAFWRGFVITYGLIPCAQNYLKNTALDFDNFKDEVKKNESNFVLYVCFMAIFTLILYVPGTIYILKTLPISLDTISDATSVMSLVKPVVNIILINTLLIAPFLNFALCAYFYKNENENFFELFLNCYKKLDLTGLFLSIIITLLAFEGGIIYLILAIPLNPFIYSINTFWYSTRVKK